MNVTRGHKCTVTKHFAKRPFSFIRHTQRLCYELLRIYDTWCTVGIWNVKRIVRTTHDEKLVVLYESQLHCRLLECCHPILESWMRRKSWMSVSSFWVASEYLPKKEYEPWKKWDLSWLMPALMYGQPSQLYKRINRPLQW